MKLSMKHQAVTLSDVVGQPRTVRRLQTLAMEPYSSCWLLEGSPGCGKSSCAKALIHDLGVSEYSVASYAGAGLKIEDVRHLFRHAFRSRPLFGSPWNVLLIEELEHTASGAVTTTLKDELSEQNLPDRLIVIATSNNASGLDEALLQRFDILSFSAGPEFAEACLDRLNWIWQLEVGMDVPMPSYVAGMGWRNNQYSMRRALSALGAAVENYVASNPKGKVAQ